MSYNGSKFYPIICPTEVEEENVTGKIEKIVIAVGVVKSQGFVTLVKIQDLAKNASLREITTLN